MIAEPFDNAINLEKIDEEIRMEKIRQNTVKLSWDGFGQAVRRNLLEKRVTFDADSRIDVLEAISFMRRKMPVDENAVFSTRIKHLADSLDCVLTENHDVYSMKNQDILIEIRCINENVASCKIGYWDSPLVESQEGVDMLRKGNLAEFRNCVLRIAGILPMDVDVKTKGACKEALKALEYILLNSSNDSSLEKINEGFGYFSPRTPLRPGRLYYVVDRMYIEKAKSVGQNYIQPKDIDDLPYIEFSFYSNEMSAEISEQEKSDTLEACICLRFSHPLLVSQGTILRLKKYFARFPLVRHYVNQYRYMAGLDQSKGEMKYLTNFSDGLTQHLYEFSAENFAMENDAVITEMYISDYKCLGKVISLLRETWELRAYFESILAMCQHRSSYENRKIDAVRMMVDLKYDGFDFVMQTKMGLRKISLERTNDNGWKLMHNVENNMAGEQLNMVFYNTRSLPCVLSSAVVAMGAIVESVEVPRSVRGEAEKDEEEKNNLEEIRSKTDKVSIAWLPCIAQNQENKSESENAEKEGGDKSLISNNGYEREQDEEFRGSLLAMFSEVDDFIKKPLLDNTIARHDANMFSDLERIRMLTESTEMPGEDKNTARVSMESPLMATPMMRTQQSFMMHQQMSPLETARLQMKQSMSAATAVALAAHTPSSGAPTPNSMHQSSVGKDVFDFPDDSSFGSPSSQISSPVSGFPYMPSRGSQRARRPRARKTVNMGDREGMSPTSGAPGTSQRGRRGGRPRGSTARKSSGMSPAEMYAMDARPHLQRSFSDYPTGNITPQHVPQTPNPYIEEDSDDECDPPPPPKQMLPPRTPSVTSPSSSTAPYLKSPNYQPLVPSPLSVSSAQSLQRQNSQPVASVFDQVEQKPDVSILNQMIKDTHAEGEATTPLTISTASPEEMKQKKKGMGIEAAISKIKMQQQSQNTPPLPQALVSRASALSDVFDDGLSSPTEDKKPQIGNMKASPAVTMETSVSSESVMDGPKLTVQLEPKITLKIPKLSRNSPNIDVQMMKVKKEKDRDREKDREKDRDRDREKERKRNKKEKEKVESKKRKHERKDKDSREPKDKKSKASPEEIINPIDIIPKLTLKNFRIPKKDTTEEIAPKEEVMAPVLATPQSSSAAPTTPNPSVATSSSNSMLSAQIKKEPTPSILPPMPPGFEYFREGSAKKKSASNLVAVGPGGGPTGPPVLYPPGPAAGRGGRKMSQSMQPPRGIPPDVYRGHQGGSRGYQSSYYAKQVASYAHGVPPGMGPPPAGPSGSHGYPGASGWGRPPAAHRDSHYHSMGPQQLPPSSKEVFKEKEKGEDMAPESPEEVLRIADE